MGDFEVVIYVFSVLIMVGVLVTVPGKVIEKVNKITYMTSKEEMENEGVNEEKKVSGTDIEKRAEKEESVTGDKKGKPDIREAVKRTTILVILLILKNLPYGSIKRYLQKKLAEMKLRKKTGNKSYKIIKEIQYFLYEEYEEEGEGGSAIRIKKVNKMKGELEEMVKMFRWNPDECGIAMYKYEKTFEDILNTFKKAKQKEVLEDMLVIDKVEEAMSYAYKDIVGDGVANKVVEDIDNEIKILKDLENKGRKG